MRLIIPLDTAKPKPKRQRADRRKTVEKVAKAMLKKPRGTEREIAALAGVDQRTVNRVKGEVPQAASKDDRILAIADADAEIVALGQKEILARFKGNRLFLEETKDISGVIKDSAARHIAFRGMMPKGQSNDALTPEAAAALVAAMAALGR